MPKAETININGTEIAISMLHPDVVRDHRLVEALFKRRDKFVKAKEEFEAVIDSKAVKRLHDTNAKITKPEDQVKQISIMSADKTRKVVVVQRDYFRLNEKANLAKTLIDQKIEKLRGQNADPDAANLITFLGTIFVGKKKISFSANLVLFLGMKFEDLTLTRAQELLREAQEADSSRFYANFFERTARGEWAPLETF